MLIVYNIVWAEEGRLKCKEFRYESDTDSECFSTKDDVDFYFSSYLPPDAYKFWRNLYLGTGQEAIVFVGDHARGNGVIRAAGDVKFIQDEEDLMGA